MPYVLDDNTFQQLKRLLAANGMELEGHRVSDTGASASSARPAEVIVKEEPSAEKASPGSSGGPRGGSSGQGPLVRGAVIAVLFGVLARGAGHGPCYHDCRFAASPAAKLWEHLKLR